VNDGLTPLLIASITFAYVTGVAFLLAGIYLSWKQRRPHPLLLVSISAIAISWIEAPYDWAMYAQFPTALPRMPSWWPMNATWGGLPASVPIGYISYFVLPALIGAALGNRAAARFGWRRPQALLGVGFAVGFVWAFCFNAMLGARLGVFYYGRVIPGLAIFEGTKHQYPLYDAIAMALQMMVFAYLLGRTDAHGRNLIESWSRRRTKTTTGTFVLSIVAVIVVGHVLYLSVFAPHLITKLRGDVTAGPTEQLFPGVQNQPFDGGVGGTPQVDTTAARGGR
jgi:Spirocyclase AveC-like